MFLYTKCYKRRDMLPKIKKISLKFGVLIWLLKIGTAKKLRPARWKRKRTKYVEVIFCEKKKEIMKIVVNRKKGSQIKKKNKKLNNLIPSRLISPWVILHNSSVRCNSRFWASNFSSCLRKSRGIPISLSLKPSFSALSQNKSVKSN